ncbi:hypothetical protein [Puia sp.]|jgi:hypothetical protein|uniref:hypothetical protein n=1 Tax=Puia sp. TaxID=2045100 RepID=UPI002F41A1E5
MNASKDISEELRSLSELVATISRQTPYRVADDYFADLSSRILLRIKTQHKPLAFNVPEGYFEGFAEGVLARIKAGGNASHQAPEAKSLRTAPETAAEELAALSPLLAQLRPLGTYRLPEGYFEELSPILVAARDKNPYTVPDEYFRQLPVEIEEKVLEAAAEAQRAPAKVVAFGGRRTNWWKYSAAAVVAGLILTIGWLRLHVNGGHQGQTPDIASSLTKVSDQDLQSFLADQDTTLALPTNNTATLDFNDNDVKSLLGDIPDGDLKQYMEDHGGPNDIATN